jgi:polyisoprenyl-phosphate glycosyltransferase
MTRTGAVGSDGRVLLSIVTPAFNEAANLPLLYDRLRAALAALPVEWEWVIVDDHSEDATFAVVRELAARDPRVRGVRFARNCGSHAALSCGLREARGDCVAALAADLQDPPDVLPELFSRWQEGAQVVWAVRARRDGETAATLAFARLYYWLMRTVVGLRDMPATGADFFLLDRTVVGALARFDEANTSILALLMWMGFRQATVTYGKEARVHGRSGWTLEKKLKLAIDSVTSFSYLPIRFMSYLGCGVALLGFAYAGHVVVNAVAGNPVEGWSSLIVVVLLLGGIQMVMMGVLGEYLWRALDETRGRPRYLVEATVGAPGTDVGSTGALPPS